MKNWLLLFILFAEQLSAQTIDRLTLGQAYELAQRNYPVIKQKDFVKQTESLTIENLQKGYLPQVTVNGQATYQSDVTEIDVSFSGFKFEAPAKDQYKVFADVNQVVYDGGVIQEQKKAARLNAEVEDQKVEVELYKLKDRINQIYLGILFLDEQIKQTDILREDVEVGIKQVDAQVKNGVALKSNLNVLKAQLLQTDQRVIELKATRKGFIETLGLFLNQSLNETTVFDKPVVNDVAVAGISRPELKLYDNQSTLIEQQNKLITARNLPKASLFAQGGYGRPALNLLKNDFDWFYIAGVRLNWPLGGLYTIKKEKQLNEVNKKMVDVQRETFLLNTNTQLKQQQSEIEKINQLIETDKGIIDLRLQVKDAARAQLQNGVITANDYLREVNAEDQARQALITHQLQLLQAQINYQTTLGKQ
ncbi:MAG TPA: TolC family protein [Chitinophagaceae bacterium]|jgi:outer membrane protein TolC|nr:TolC family protein [Chitinophagaceae bacterium]